MSIELGTFLISVLALVFSVRSWLKSSNIAHEQNKLQERLVKIEESRDSEKRRSDQKASLIIERKKDGRRTIFTLVNKGPGTAWDIKILIDGKSSGELSWLKHLESGELGPQAKRDSDPTLGRHNKDPSKASIKVNWKDGSGQPGEWSV